jgi:bifunctional polynucleotide phosphatase/kinase
MVKGKSFYYKTFYEPKGYVRINQDSLKSKARCLSKAKQELDSGSSVVIDNTNPDPATRKEYIKIAKEYSVPVKCVYFDVPEEICLHNNAYRELHEKDKKRVPGIAYHSFYTKFQLPCLDEGFDSVETVNWYPRFNSEQAKEAWQLFYS